MKIIHSLWENQISKEVSSQDNQHGLMLGRGGSFFWTGVAPISRYQGWFFGFGGNSLIKIIDDIRPKGRGEVITLANYFTGGGKTSREFEEKIFLSGRESLVYELDKIGEIEIFFDIKDLYKTPEYGRNYKTWYEDGIIIVNFRQDGEFPVPEIFAAICGNLENVTLKNEWVKRDYSYDRERADAPAERWVFKPGDFCAQKIAVGTGFTKDEAITAGCDALHNLERLKRERQAEVMGEKKTAFGFWRRKETDGAAILAKECAAGALKILYSQSGGRPALRAGLPWFFQIWRRDEAVSLRGLSFADRTAALAMLWRQIDDLAAVGFCDANSSDAAGWLFLRAGEFIQEGKMNLRETEKIYEVLEKTIEDLWTRDTRKGFAVSNFKFTWMDSLPRMGAPIEVQALRLNMYSLAASLAASGAKKQRYLELEQNLADAVRKTFFDGHCLADNYDIDAERADFRSRPNVFLAAYVYPKLLKKSEWTLCFNRALAGLWLDWGGLSTVGRNDPEFCPRDTGNDPRAYHNGDSWFWVNNIAAITMNRLSRTKYRHYVEKIFAASLEDLLWHGAVGCASEISGAEIYGAAGCVNQAWSNATFLELFREVGKF